MENQNTGMKVEFWFAEAFHADEIANAAPGKTTNMPADHQ
jgi:hypothetical protein